jgi:hypothetical protein
VAITSGDAMTRRAVEPSGHPITFADWTWAIRRVRRQEGGGAERPTNIGGRFLTKTLAASRWSSVCAVAIMRAASLSMSSVEVPLSARSISDADRRAGVVEPARLGPADEPRQESARSRCVVGAVRYRV